MFRGDRHGARPLYSSVHTAGRLGRTRRAGAVVGVRLLLQLIDAIWRLFWADMPRTRSAVVSEGENPNASLSFLLFPACVAVAVAVAVAVTFDASSNKFKVIPKLIMGSWLYICLYCFVGKG